MTKLSNIKLLETFRIFTNQKTRPLIDRIVDLYKQGVFNIATGKKLANQATGRGKAPQTALKRVEEYEIKKQQPPKQAKNKTKNEKTYFVTGNVTLKRTYFTKQTQKSANPVKHHKTYHDTQSVTITVKATTQAEAREIVIGQIAIELHRNFFTKQRRNMKASISQASLKNFSMQQNHQNLDQ